MPARSHARRLLSPAWRAWRARRARLASGACAACGAVMALAALAGCSSESAAEPEAGVRTQGAFVAVDEGGPGLALYRTLDVLVLDGQSDVLFISRYAVAPADWDEAREVAKGHDIPLDVPSDAVPETGYPSGPYRVVWFRTLTDEEKDRVQ